MNKTQRLLNGLIACGVALAMVSGLAAQSDDHNVAKVVRLKGGARYKIGNNEWQQLKLGDILTEPLVTVGEDEGYAATIYQMVERGVRRMPVVAANGELTGIITFDDLLRQLVTPLAELSELAGRERRAEMRKRQ